MRIAYLADEPGHAEAVAALRFGEWSRYYPGSDQEKWLERLRSQCGKGSVPTVLIAMRDAQVLGSAALVQFDMTILRDRTPWLSGVVVKREERNRGIGSRLVEAIEGEARRLGFPELHLFTFDKRSFYEARGWSWNQDVDYAGTRVAIMKKRSGS